MPNLVNNLIATEYDGLLGKAEGLIVIVARPSDRQGELEPLRNKLAQGRRARPHGRAQLARSCGARWPNGLRRLRPDARRQHRHRVRRAKARSPHRRRSSTADGRPRSRGKIQLRGAMLRGRAARREGRGRPRRACPTRRPSAWSARRLRSSARCAAGRDDAQRGALASTARVLQSSRQGRQGRWHRRGRGRRRRARARRFPDPHRSLGAHRAFRHRRRRAKTGFPTSRRPRETNRPTFVNLSGDSNVQRHARPRAHGHRREARRPHPHPGLQGGQAPREAAGACQRRCARRRRRRRGRGRRRRRRGRRPRSTVVLEAVRPTRRSRSSRKSARSPAWASRKPRTSSTARPSRSSEGGSSKDEAEKIKKQLEDAGAKVKIKLGPLTVLIDGARPMGDRGRPLLSPAEVVVARVIRQDVAGGRAEGSFGGGAGGRRRARDTATGGATGSAPDRRIGAPSTPQVPSAPRVRVTGAPDPRVAVSCVPLDQAVPAQAPQEKSGGVRPSTTDRAPSFGRGSLRGRSVSRPTVRAPFSAAPKGRRVGSSAASSAGAWRLRAPSLRRASRGAIDDDFVFERQRLRRRVPCQGARGPADHPVRVPARLRGSRPRRAPDEVLRGLPPGGGPARAPHRLRARGHPARGVPDPVVRRDDGARVPRVRAREAALHDRRVPPAAAHVRLPVQGAPAPDQAGADRGRGVSRRDPRS